MFRTFAAAALIAGAALLPGTAMAADTIQVVSGPTGARGAQIAYYGPIGQSFTAIDANLTSFGFDFQTFNSDAAAAPVTFSLLAGDGLTGDTIFTRTLNLPDNLPARTNSFYDFDITGATVTVGQHYTAVLSTDTSRYGLALGPEVNIYTGVFSGGDAYAGGQAFFTKQAFSNCTNDATSDCDLNFRVTGSNDAVAAVPEPASWAMMIGGFAVAGGSLRRRSRRVARVAHA